LDWLKDIKLEDMPNSDMQMIAETCGVEAAVTLMREFAGTQLTVPTFWHKRVIMRKIVEEFDGANVEKLAVRFGVSKTFVYDTLMAHRKARIQPVGDPQGMLFKEGKR
jgi:Mor family transcriptional regulator